MTDACSYIATRESNDPAVDRDSARSMLNANCSEGIQYNVSTHGDAEQSTAQTGTQEDAQVLLVEF